MAGGGDEDAEGFGTAATAAGVNVGRGGGGGSGCWVGGEDAEGLGTAATGGVNVGRGRTMVAKRNHGRDGAPCQIQLAHEDWYQIPDYSLVTAASLNTNICFFTLTFAVPQKKCYSTAFLLFSKFNGGRNT
ncbi:hypothetical protein L1987_56706 [Smallanthus sonchifolius]|uniref:Uncharacterized protein n=1 Tax=Smallanthus sonchifolius TaxID=185202 RepID=A0ACB9EEL3_9ASTR|nr:hypothetical protein L1987_56706 [Smallanthus sonchifolius]